MSQIRSVVLRNGIVVQQLGIGTYKASLKRPMADIFEDAFEIGYRAIDTAEHYGNEKEVGDAIRKSGRDRDTLYLSTKIWNLDHGYYKTMEAFERSKERLGTRIDTILIHWPCPMKGLYKETWKALCELYRKGEVRAIGVSNFKIDHLESLRETGLEIPMINQIEMHPFFIDDRLLKYCRENEIMVEAWSPLLRGGEIVDNSMVKALSEKYGKSPVQIILRYLTQYGVRVLIKASGKHHAKENANIFDFELEREDIEELKKLNTRKRYFQDPDQYYI